jgi:phosphatidylserine decarboxylase
LLVAVAGGLVALWLVFSVFCLYFFRDPNPAIPTAADAILSPANGKVDVIEEFEEPAFMGGRCRRISIFLSVFDVHLQRAPAAGRVAYYRHTPGRFVNAMLPESALENENLYVGLASTERSGEKIGVRMIAGLIARRIVPWISRESVVERGERICLIQFGSRVDLYLPLETRVEVKLGDKVRGGETVIARRC